MNSLCTDLYKYNCKRSFSANYEANGKGPDQGLRLCRDSK